MSNDNVIKMVDSLADGDNIAAQDAFKRIQDASGLDDVGVVSEPGLQAEPIEIDSEEDENEQPAVSEV